MTIGLLTATVCLAARPCAFADVVPARRPGGPPRSAEGGTHARQEPTGAAGGGLDEPAANAMEPMDGPDAWELLKLGPFGLVHRGAAGPPRGGPAMQLNAFDQHQRDLEERLGVTAAQHARIQAILNREEQSDALQRRTLERTGQELQGLLRSASATRAAIELKIDTVARLRAALTKSRLRALFDTRGVLTPAQRSRLQALDEERRGREVPPPLP